MKHVGMSSCAALVVITVMYLNVLVHAGQPLERIEVLPNEVALSSDRDSAQVLVTGYTADGTAIDLTRTATYSESKTCTIGSGYVQSQTNGDETVEVQVGNLAASLDIRVVNAEKPRPISFRHETLAVLTKQGCNSGGCHGKPNGRGALELSLNAFDPMLDERNLVRGSFARFTEPLVPEKSLMLKKPTLQVPHGGGKRLREDDQTYAILRQWIYEGCEVDAEDAPTCISVHVQPERRVVQLTDGKSQQQMRVIAEFSDGSRRDVTRISTFSSSDEAVAKVDRYGLVTGVDRGQTAVVVRYLDEIVSGHLTFVRDVPGYKWSNPPEQNYVDRLVHQKLRQLQYLPSDVCDDGTFLRRLSIDVRGLLPTAEEARDFLKDTSASKRAAIIDRYLDSPEYARFWSLRMADLLRISQDSLSPERAAAYSDWVFQSVESNVPYDQFVSELLTASGKTSQIQAANFFRVTSDTKQVGETVAQVFMGSRIMCAQCHNHPYESWTQDNYYQIGAAFHEVDRKPTDGKKADNEKEIEVSLTLGRAMSNPRTGVEQKPWPIDVERAANEDKRIAFARWLTSGDNSYFSRVAVNRIWAHLMGRGIVEPIDDFRSSNPPVNSELLNALASDFVDSGFDRKHLIRTILNSSTYQRGSRANEFNATDEKLFSRARIRLISAERIQDAVTRLCDGEDRLGKWQAVIDAAQSQLADPDIDAEFRDEVKKKRDDARKKMDSYFMTQQPYPHLTPFLKAFGQPERKTACACERREEVSLDQALQLMNSDLIRERVAAARVNFEMLSDNELAERLYLNAFTRLPSASERATVAEHLNASKDRGQAIEDLVWALINTNEFLFQH